MQLQPSSSPPPTFLISPSSPSSPTSPTAALISPNKASNTSNSPCQYPYQCTVTAVKGPARSDSDPTRNTSRTTTSSSVSTSASASTAASAASASSSTTVIPSSDSASKSKPNSSSSSSASSSLLSRAASWGSKNVRRPKSKRSHSRSRSNSSTNLAALATSNLVAAFSRTRHDMPYDVSAPMPESAAVAVALAEPLPIPADSPSMGVSAAAPMSSPPLSHVIPAAAPAASSSSGSTPPEPSEPAAIPPLLASGVPMLKVSSKKIKAVTVRFSSTSITWPSRKGGKIEIACIRELRLGQSPTEANAYDSARWITIVYVRDKQWKVVHFIARTDDVYALWVKTLHSLVAENSDRVVSGAIPPASDPELRFIRQLWPVGVTTISEEKAAGIWTHLGLVVPPPILHKYKPLFPINIATFRQLVRDVQTRPELGEIYQRLGANLSRDRVRAFLNDVQGERNIDFEDVFKRYADAEQDAWTADSLASYLSSRDNVPDCSQDFSRPLTEYFIASSHNTYLVAEQWRGESTVEGYIRVLLAGCRCVEVDCHDGGSDGPNVYHGKTITSSVPVRDVCQAINKYAFVASPYPVVISLEIRCNVEQQDKLAAIIRESFGERLVTEPIDLDHIDTVPSPESLKGRIIIKTKPMPQHIAATPPSFSPPPSSPHLVPPIISASPPQTQDSTDSTTESDSSFVRLARRLSVSSGPNTKTPQGHSRALTDLPVYTSAVKYRGFSKLVKYDFNHMFSLSENTANRILKAGQGPDWVKHNFTHLTRIYPKGVRLTSSNYDPRPFWLSGAQLVALNYQTQDAGSMYNEALFHSSGYVLKPLGLRQKVVEETQAYRLRLHIISAQRLPPMDDLYVEATVGDEVLRTKATKGVSLTPRWDETLEYIVEARPSVVGMTFVHLEIRLSRGVVAQWTRPLSDTGRGYRYLPLADRDRQKYLFATLFARIDLEPLPAKTPSANANTPSKAVPQPIGYGAL